jgi:hypothetical protein
MKKKIKNRNKIKRSAATVQWKSTHLFLDGVCVCVCVWTWFGCLSNCKACFHVVSLISSFLFLYTELMMSVWYVVYRSENSSEMISLSLFICTHLQSKEGQRQQRESLILYNQKRKLRGLATSQTRPSHFFLGGARSKGTSYRYSLL